MTYTSKEIELDDEERKLLADAANRTGKPWRTLLREAIARFIKAEAEPVHRHRDASPENLLEKLERLGAVGMISGGPPDVSTNKKYMEGFGRDT
jgi:hypothetical protein